MRFSLGLLAFVLVLAAVSAQPTGTSVAVPTVAASGTAEIKRAPQIVRVQIEVLSQGKTLAEALENLKTRREEVKTALEKLGATTESIRFADATTVPDMSDRQRQVDRYLMERNRALQKPRGASTAPVVVSSQARVELPLPETKSSDELLIAAKSLEDKVKAADLGGLKLGSKVSPQEAEAREESEGPSGRGQDEHSGEPVFVYVSKVKDEEKAKVLARAFDLAKREAQRLATAASSELGDVQHLSSQFPSPDGDYNPYAQREYAMMMRQRMGMSEDESSESEAVAYQPGPVSLRVNVLVQFALKPAK